MGVRQRAYFTGNAHVQCSYRSRCYVSWHKNASGWLRYQRTARGNVRRCPSNGAYRYNALCGGFVPRAGYAINAASVIKIAVVRNSNDERWRCSNRCAMKGHMFPHACRSNPPRCYCRSGGPAGEGVRDVRITRRCSKRKAVVGGENRPCFARRRAVKCASVRLNVLRRDVKKANTLSRCCDRQGAEVRQVFPR